MVRHYFFRMFAALGLLIAVFPTSFAYTAPVFAPAAEIGLQVALNGAAALPANDPTLRHRLTESEIRTSLQDTARLRGELG